MILQKKYYKKVIYKKEEKYEERRGKKEDGRKRLSFTPKRNKAKWTLYYGGCSWRRWFWNYLCRQG